MLWLIPFDSVFLPFGGPVDATLDRAAAGLAGGIWLWSAAAPPATARPGTSPIHWAFATFIAVRRAQRSCSTPRRWSASTSSTWRSSRSPCSPPTASSSPSPPRSSGPRRSPKLVKACSAWRLTAFAVVIEYRFGINVFHDWIGPLFPGYVRPFGTRASRLDRAQAGLRAGGAAAGGGGDVLDGPAVRLRLADQSQGAAERLVYGIVVLLLFAGSAGDRRRRPAWWALAAGLAVLFVYRPAPDGPPGAARIVLCWCRPPRSPRARSAGSSTSSTRHG